MFVKYTFRAHLFLSLPADLSTKKYRVLNVACQGTNICNFFNNIAYYLNKNDLLSKKCLKKGNFSYFYV